MAKGWDFERATCNRLTPSGLPLLRQGFGGQAPPAFARCRLPRFDVAFPRAMPPPSVRSQLPRFDAALRGLAPPSSARSTFPRFGVAGARRPGPFRPPYVRRQLSVRPRTDSPANRCSMWPRLQPRIATPPPSACSSARATRQGTAGNRSGREPLCVSPRSGSASGRGSDSWPDPMAARHPTPKPGKKHAHDLG